MQDRGQETLRSYPLKRMILWLAKIHMGVVTGICLSMLLWESHILTEIRGTMESSTELLAYFETAEWLDEALDIFVHMQGREQRENCHNLSAALSQSADSLKNAFGEPEFQDHYYLTESYLEAVGKLLEIHAPELSGEEICLYGDCQRIYGYILDNRKILNQACTTDLSKRYEEMFRLWKNQFLFHGGIAVLSALFLIRICKGLAEKIGEPLDALSRQAQAFAKGEYMRRTENGENIRIRETQLLWESFFHMAETIQRQMEQLVQSMISPHFLFNCLGTLSALAYFEHAPKTRKASQQISDYLRKTQALVGRENSLLEELAHAREYIAIQQLRFEDRIRFETVCDVSCGEFQIPALILQPLIENCIHHGLRRRTEGGAVETRIREEEGEIVISVRDNGAGMEPEELEELREKILQPFEPKRHTVGLHSISTRIRSRFGERARILVESSPQKGTCVWIRIQK